MQIKHPPYHLLLLTCVILFIGGFFSLDIPIDIHLHDTYFVFPMSFLAWAPAIILFTFWLLYLATKQFLFSKRLVWVHVILTSVISLTILVLPYISKYAYGGAGAPRRYYDYGTFNDFKVLDNFTNIAVTAFIILLLGQLLYVINLSVGLYRHKNLSKNR